jgi:hypothetical protein
VVTRRGLRSIDLTDLALTVEGLIDVVARQEWAVRHLLAP